MDIKYLCLIFLPLLHLLTLEFMIRKYTPNTALNERNNASHLGLLPALRSNDTQSFKCYKYFGCSVYTLPRNFVFQICLTNQNTDMLEYLVKHWKISNAQIIKSCEHTTRYRPPAFEIATETDRSGTILPWLYQKGCDFSVRFIMHVFVF